MIYYSGHGVPDESSKDSYLIPIDGYPTDTSTCYKIQDLYDTFGNIPVSKVIMLIDACFSGSQRNSEMLTQARSVVLKPKPSYLSGNLAVMTACKDDETAYTFDSEKHGIFTYYLLKKLKASKGDVTLLELADYVKENVLKQALLSKGKSQTPTLRFSKSLESPNSLKF